MLKIKVIYFVFIVIVVVYKHEIFGLEETKYHLFSIVNLRSKDLHPLCNQRCNFSLIRSVFPLLKHGDTIVH